MPWRCVAAVLTNRSGDATQVTQDTQDELMNLMTIMYVVMQETLNDLEDMAVTYDKLRKSHECRERIY